MTSTPRPFEPVPGSEKLVPAADYLASQVPRKKAGAVLPAFVARVARLAGAAWPALRLMARKAGIRAARDAAGKADAEGITTEGERR